MTDDVKEAIEYFKDRQDIIFANADRKKHIKTLIRAAQSANKVELIIDNTHRDYVMVLVKHGSEIVTSYPMQREDFIAEDKVGAVTHVLIIKPDAESGE